LNGSALGSDASVTVTQPIVGQAGAAWDATPLDLSKNFDMSFKVFLGSDPSGSDGMAFVLQSEGLTALGCAGGALGFGSFMCGATPPISPSVAVEMDTHSNADAVIMDPPYDHLGVDENGALNHNGAAAVAAFPSEATMKDGVEHTLEIAWNASTTTMTISFDGLLRITYTKNIVNLIFGGNPMVYWGFTGGTGGGVELQYARILTCPITPTPTPSPTITPTPTPGVIAPNCQDQLHLSQNIYHFSGPTELNIQASLCVAGFYQVFVYNSAGEKVRTLRDTSTQPAGTENISWDGRNTVGQPVASGVYVIHYSTRWSVHESRLVVLR
jgi:hypothetical protein